MRYKKFNDEVLYSLDPVVQVRAEDIAFLKAEAARNPRQRIRLCAHPGVEDKTHEMFIVHSQGTYVRPHKHFHKSESFHVLEGEVDVVLFDDNGQRVETIRMGAFSTGKVFYYRVTAPVFHTLRIISDTVCFKEVTGGPFNREDTFFAPWSPEDGDTSRVEAFLKELAI